MNTRCDWDPTSPLAHSLDFEDCTRSFFVNKMPSRIRFRANTSFASVCSTYFFYCICNVTLWLV